MSVESKSSGSPLQKQGVTQVRCSSYLLTDAIVCVASEEASCSKHARLASRYRVDMLVELELEPLDL
jgi:hypothetical protein